jgi:hypothetical protein
MTLADLYAQKHGYINSNFMLEKLNLAKQTFSGSLEYSIQDAIIRALKTIDEKLSDD